MSPGPPLLVLENNSLMINLSIVIVNEILEFIPFKPCYICNTKINILHKENIFYSVSNIYFCSIECMNIETYDPFI